MKFEPSLNTFCKNIKQEKSQIIWTSLVADLDTPVAAMLKIGSDLPYSFLLESVEGGDTRGRYSILGLNPDIIWKCYGDKAEINFDAINSHNVYKKESFGTLESLRNLIKISKINLPEFLPPMAAGLVGYLGFDTIRLSENINSINQSKLKLPDGLFIRPTIMLIFDSVKDIITIVTPIFLNTANSINLDNLYKEGCERINKIVKLLNNNIKNKTLNNNVLKDIPHIKSNFTKKEYIRNVDKAKEYIVAGDIFQVVPSQRFEIPFDLPPFNLYRALRRLNPSPFLYYLNFDHFSVVGSSPEILVRVRNDKVTIRPIAGTRPRGKTNEEDMQLANELLNDEKEIAEHIMLLDLARNDVGRVAQKGTVKVSQKMIIEKYSHVMHIVSNVEGIIKPSYDYLDALLAGFPAGTVSGAPKIRAIEIIDELENEKREIYGGCVGYFSSNGDMDTCITLRTALLMNKKMYVQAGGGVVADSVPEKEYEETVNKAKALFRAANEALLFSQ